MRLGVAQAFTAKSPVKSSSPMKDLAEVASSIPEEEKTPSIQEEEPQVAVCDIAPEQFEDAPVQIEQQESESVSIRVESATGFGNPMAAVEDQEGPATEQDTQEEDREAPQPKSTSLIDSYQEP